MAKLYSTLVIRHFQDGLFVVITDGNRLLVGLEEIIVSRDRDAIERAISNDSARFRCYIIGGEGLDVCRCGIRDNARDHCSIFMSGAIAYRQLETYLTLVR